jgi:hypothetical protein
VCALCVEGEIEGCSQAQTSMDGQWRNPCKRRNRNTPLRSAIVEAGTLIVGGMCGYGVPGRCYGKLWRNTSRHQQAS